MSTNNEAVGTGRPDMDLYSNSSICGSNETLCFNYNLMNSSRVANDTYPDTEPMDAVVMGATSVVLGFLILVTVVGNVFVIAAILLEKNLQNVANYLIVSLAVADLMVACLVMPLGAVYVISKDWILGPELCDMWTSCDVLCCTASILHLVAIAVDRYWAVTDINYIQTRDVKHIGVMIMLVWCVALIVSLAPQFGWKDPDYITRINEQKCLVSQDIAYQIFATCSTFYVPLMIILVLYWKIFQAARRRIRRNRPIDAVPDVDPDDNVKGSCGFLALFRGNKEDDPESGTAGAFAMESMADAPHQGEISTENPSDVQETAFTISTGPGASTSHAISPLPSGSGISPAPQARAARAVDPVRAQREKKESLEAKRERKAAKTLAIITGAFVICWLPFFVTAILTPIFGPVSDHLANFILWLGYFNSTLNPVIYTIFSPEFRQAFKRILFGTEGGDARFRPGKRN